MRFRIPVLLAMLALAAFSRGALAVGVLIPAPARVDMVHDARRGIIYISAGAQVLRYSTKYRQFRSPIVLGGQLGGLDLSPDGNTLVVTDRVGSATQVWVHLVALETGLSRKVYANKELYSGEGGTFTAVYGADSRVYTSSTFSGSGWVPLRRLDPATDTWVTLASICQDTMLAASGDGQTIAFAESNISDGRWGLWDIPTGTLVQRQWYTDGTSWFNYEISTDRFGSQFVIPTYGGGMVYDDAYQKIATLGAYAGPQPIGGAYHPVDAVAYLPWATTSEVRIYNMSTRTQVGSLDFQSPFSHPGNHAFGAGRTRLSRDGSVLMVSVDGGVRYVEMYAPLSAAPVNAQVAQTGTLEVILPASIGNGGPIEYSLPARPDFGTAVLSGNVLTYTPQSNFLGTFSFPFRARYGRAEQTALVTLEIVPPTLPGLRRSARPVPQRRARIRAY